MWYKNIASRFFGLVTKHTRDRRTDGQTDGQNYDSQDRASIAASRGKNHFFYSIADTCLHSEDIARQSCAMVHRWRFFCVLYFQRAACSTFQTCILNSHEGHIMCRSMVDIQSTTAEIRRVIKKIERNHRAKI